jgi:methylenetetrahydrofolate--tRNA-(uracil-5-)-methyltransferase
MNVNFGLFPPLEVFGEKGKRLKGRSRKQAMSIRALLDFDGWVKRKA